VNVENCNFTGVKWDENAIEAVVIVAQGLLNLTELFSAQAINIECLLRVGKEEDKCQRKLKKTG
jgi:hypothetical protein